MYKRQLLPLGFDSSNEDRDLLFSRPGGLGNFRVASLAVEKQEIHKHYRPTISDGSTHLSKSTPSMSPSFRAASRRVVPSLCAVLAMRAALS